MDTSPRSALHRLMMPRPLPMRAASLLPRTMATHAGYPRRDRRMAWKATLIGKPSGHKHAHPWRNFGLTLGGC